MMDMDTVGRMHSTEQTLHASNMPECLLFPQQDEAKQPLKPPEALKT